MAFRKTLECMKISVVETAFFLIFVTVCLKIIKPHIIGVALHPHESVVRILFVVKLLGVFVLFLKGREFLAC